MTETESNSTFPDSALNITSANFESRKFQRIDDDTLRIKPTTGSLAFSLLFVMLGLGICALTIASATTELDGPASFPVTMIGLLIFASGIWSYHSNNEQMVVNRQTGIAYLRSWRPTIPLDTTAMFKHIQPQDLVGIQVVSRRVKRRSNRSKRLNSHVEYQVNLCTSDGERHNAFATLKAEKADDLGNQLSHLFDVPLVSS